MRHICLQIETFFGLIVAKCVTSAISFLIFGGFCPVLLPKCRNFAPVKSSVERFAGDKTFKV